MNPTAFIITTTATTETIDTFPCRIRLAVSGWSPDLQKRFLLWTDLVERRIRCREDNRAFTRVIREFYVHRIHSSRWLAQSWPRRGLLETTRDFWIFTKWRYNVHEFLGFFSNHQKVQLNQSFSRMSGDNNNDTSRTSRNIPNHKYIRIICFILQLLSSSFQLPRKRRSLSILLERNRSIWKPSRCLQQMNNFE